MIGAIKRFKTKRSKPDVLAYMNGIEVVHGQIIRLTRKDGGVHFFRVGEELLISDGEWWVEHDGVLIRLDEY